MKNKLIISYLVHFLLGILFVFPVYSAEGMEESSRVLTEIGYYGEKEDDGPAVKVSKKQFYFSKLLHDIKNLGTFSFIPKWICEGDPGSKLLLKFSQQIVDISLLKCIRSVVILC